MAWGITHPLSWEVSNGVTPWPRATRDTRTLLHPSHSLDLLVWILPLLRGQNSNFKGQLYKQDIGVFIFLSKHQHKQQGSSGWFMRWECFFELDGGWGLLQGVGRNRWRLDLLRSSPSGPGGPSCWLLQMKFSPSILPLSHSHKKSTHQRRPFFLLFISQKSSSLHFSDTIQNKQQDFVS